MHERVSHGSANFPETILGPCPRCGTPIDCRPTDIRLAPYDGKLYAGRCTSCFVYTNVGVPARYQLKAALPARNPDAR